MQPDPKLLEHTTRPPNGLEERFSDFYRRHYWMVLRFAERRLSSHETSRDIASETFRIAWTKFQDAEPGGLAFLYLTCKNLIGNEYRRQLRVAALDVTLQHGAGASNTEDHAVALREAMLKMREAEREVLYLTYWEEASAEQLAKTLGCSQDAAWARVSRARKSLKNILRSGGSNA
ncbi:RNA polymerase sigma factor [Paeniglutamicibacter kerguelensis]|uniref:RNA polymerase sigma-70 factor (ECF subfamily) n=1 Tax=Paeniglutamicibacter kerguelensis TaxID=254788 RepID=A0ABS4XH54_9MICC|nr:sigma-70 family RNA polymerase sigma factor [Paeniglutamicibacter kerguelensis]MBP2387024.1 RNA polymerase sigma-70 factor (ECF subfamily) [Paeniglutamicibacter kerguelensis]